MKNEKEIIAFNGYLALLIFLLLITSGVLALINLNSIWPALIFVIALFMLPGFTRIR